jgi:hypothetical protein
VCLVSGPNRVDIDRLAAVLSEPGIRRATAREARELTGFPIGGIPPFGHDRAIRVVMDPDLGRFPIVWAAAGTATAVFGVPPATLASLANAHLAPITVDGRSDDTGAEGSGGDARTTGTGTAGTGTADAGSAGAGTAAGSAAGSASPNAVV